MEESLIRLVPKVTDKGLRSQISRFDNPNRSMTVNTSQDERTFNSGYSKTCGKSTGGLYLLPTILSVLFLMDFIDWLTHDDKLKTIALDDPNDRFPQSPIITGLTFFRGMFTMFLASVATFSFITKLNSLTNSLRELDKVSLKKSSKESERRLNVYHISQKYGKGVKIAWVAVLYLAIESLAALIFIIIKQWMIRQDFWEPMNFLFMPTAPNGVIKLIRIVAEFLSQISLLPIYLFYVRVCSLYTKAARKFNSQLEDALVKVIAAASMADTKGPGAASNTAQTQVPTSPTSGCINFEQLLRQLRIKQEALIAASDDMSTAWSSTLACLIFGSLAILASLTSFCFTISAQNAGFGSMVLFAGHISQPLVGLLIIVVFAVIFEETSLRSKPVWKELITCRQRTRDKVHATDEDGCLLTILHTIEHHSYSLKLSRTIGIDRGFGIGMVMGFLGFVCFLIERSENYRVPSQQLETLLNTSYIYSGNATVFSDFSDSNSTHRP